MTLREMIDRMDILADVITDEEFLRNSSLSDVSGLLYAAERIVATLQKHMKTRYDSDI